jgi:hypothetical protein
MPTELRILIEDRALLDRLKVKTEADDYGEVLGNALKLYEAMIERHEAGKRLYERTDAGEYVEMTIFKPQ